MSFRPALIVVDFQEDFCSGSLAVPEGRTIAPIVNLLLNLPFSLKIATKDFHPQDHISFATNHPVPNNVPFTSFETIKNPNNPNETFVTRLWPVHCVQGTPGVELIPEFDLKNVDKIIEKGMDSRVEMYSAFEAPFRDPIVKEASSGLGQLLRESGITDCFVVGLAMDYCVKSTAIDAQNEGFRTYVVREGTKAVDPGPEGWGKTEKELKEAGVQLVNVDGAEIDKVKALAQM
ncbi:Isochorismatase hydrolase [Dendrothele bispora CBS 962.96]|uniref:nicotinamidase n=1 Tax=Dendrothele bispora (strain CBS 962.96) TaxID=1314807 RepID=A0A4S8MQJ6_DENBC|nr:Isochorismatase hydrolase [Dendrothele bispora CBS 962.96]